VLLDYAQTMAKGPAKRASKAHLSMLLGAMKRLEARLLAQDPPRAIQTLLEGQDLLRRSVEEFQKARSGDAVGVAEIHLAGLLVDHALRLDPDDAARAALMSEVRARLDGAEAHIW
jgi:hypothetical protein